MLQTATKLRINFEKNKEMATPAKLASEVLKDIKDFNLCMPLIRVFSNKGLKERHWDEITDIVGFIVKPSMEIKLTRIIQMDLPVDKTE